MDDDSSGLLQGPACPVLRMVPGIQLVLRDDHFITVLVLSACTCVSGRAATTHVSAELVGEFP